MPINPAVGKPTGWSPTSLTELADQTAYKTAIKKWNDNDVIVRQQIAVLIPDSLFIQLLSLPTAKEFFNILNGVGKLLETWGKAGKKSLVSS